MLPLIYVFAIPQRRRFAMAAAAAADRPASHEISFTPLHCHDLSEAMPELMMSRFLLRCRRHFDISPSSRHEADTECR